MSSSGTKLHIMLRVVGKSAGAMWERGLNIVIRFQEIDWKAYGAHKKVDSPECTAKKKYSLLWNIGVKTSTVDESRHRYYKYLWSRLPRFRNDGRPFVTCRYGDAYRYDCVQPAFWSMMVVVWWSMAVSVRAVSATKISYWPSLCESYVRGALAASVRSQW